MAGTGLLFGRGNDPDIVRKLPHDALEQPQAACVHAVVVGQQDPHARPMREASFRCNCEGHGGQLRHIRNSLAICSLGDGQRLLTVGGVFIRDLGMTGFRVSLGKVSLKSPPAAPVARPQPGGGVWDVRDGEIAGLCGEGHQWLRL
jgi:hypothetical protein